MRVELTPEHAAQLVRRDAWTAAVLGTVGLALQTVWPLTRADVTVWCSALGLAALALAAIGGRTAWRRSRQTPAFWVELTDAFLTAQWAGEEPVHIPTSSITQVKPRRSWILVMGRPGRSGILLPKSLPQITALRAALARVQRGEAPGPATLQPPPAAPPPPAEKPGEARVRAVARWSLWAGLAALIATVAGGLTVGVDLGLPLAGGVAVCVATWIGADRAALVLVRGEITQRSRYGPPVTFTGTKARWIAALNLSGAVVLGVLGLLVLIPGLFALLF